MNSDEERALFELYCWSQDMVQRKWIAPDQIASDGSQFDVEIGFDEVVGLSQEKEGEQQLRRFILECKQWSRGNALDEKELLEDFIRRLSEGDIDDPEEAAGTLMRGMGWG